MGIPMKANIGSAEEVQAMFAKIVETVGPVDILVNNAGRKIIH
jgi:NAD(P)-dependent dehydrogenase (short-subunit alcohol dehydrogenase family)